jgi:hypothetical protein
MNNEKTHEYLVRLRDVIIQEREFAKKLDMEKMATVMGEKEELLQYLSHVQALDERDKPLAAEIRSENRRNAFLFSATLGWIRGMMEFFGERTVTATYSSSAASVPSLVHGRLLSGRI